MPDMTGLTDSSGDSAATLVVVDRDGVEHRYAGRGVADLWRLSREMPHLLSGAHVIDKVVGRGAAALMAVSGVASVHALVITDPALAMLRAEGVAVTYDCLVPVIVNRRGTGPCPVEALTAGCLTAAECIPLIDEFVNR